ncbi:acetyl-CoA acetyltransferase [Sphingomonas kyeonggiensis]|uniref:Acetyl-CoA acetyltransferase n=1 Tax=Sphingomonas kyeonggiensis TaxID=1268553 RepID=A0A7W6NZ47_9SPHN|nr:acetyl-CoA acetyltransferase [Sphingomonas kyeonggiensis]MBB4101362.1 acetyl-CoA acetyltransferase [Sphingomonas kyeonggiensis]
MAPDTPVILGIGESIDRPFAISSAREPLALMADAARAADRDAGGGLLAQVDALDVVSIVSWRYADAAASLSAELGIAPALRANHAVGGESPVRLIHEAALRIARGESRVALIAGAEAQHSAARAKREGEMPPWTPFAKDAPSPLRGADIVHPLALRHGLSTPTQVYPLFEMASAALWGQSPAEARVESGSLWARYAAAAAENPRAWMRKAPGADEIVTPGEANRLIAWPYTKLMVANPLVNQGAAVIVTSLEAARQAGIPDERIVHILGGAAASEPRDFLARDGFAGSPAQDAVLAAASALAPQGFDVLELYSCFPCVPKMARRSLGLGPDVRPSVTGGLTFFGGPLSNYMLHAACAMVRAVRGGGVGLLYGQGEFVTKHHALVLAGQAGAEIAPDYSVQAQADARRGPVPELVEPEPGPATLESATILYQRDGSVERGVVVLRTLEGARTLASVPAEDRETLALITDDARFPVGLIGTITEQGAWSPK